MLDDYAFRSLERLCKQQAALTSEHRTRRVLEEMALEYGRKAERSERAEAVNNGAIRTLSGDRCPISIADAVSCKELEEPEPPGGPV
jgi:hypothetical protein